MAVFLHEKVFTFALVACFCPPVTISTHFAQELCEFSPRFRSRLNKVKEWRVLAKTTLWQREHHLKI